MSLTGLLPLDHLTNPYDAIEQLHEIDAYTAFSLETNRRIHQDTIQT